MQAQRLLENLHAQQNRELDAFFGSPRLVDDSHSVSPFAKVKRVAVLTESFLAESGRCGQDGILDGSLPSGDRSRGFSLRAGYRC